MMKKLTLLVFVSVVFSITGWTQNVQTHYDFGEERKMFTTTVEMFKPDKFGSTFFFIDLDYASEPRGIDQGVSLAYWEIARSFKLKEDQMLQARVEFNSGMGRASLFHYPINNAFLAGAEYSFASGDFSKVLTLQANYKFIQDKHNASFQLTAVWGMHFLEGKISFTGFADFWREDNSFGMLDPTETSFVFLSEPQLWFNYDEHLSIGGELEIGSNFGGVMGFAANPTLAVKYSF